MASNRASSKFTRKLLLYFGFNPKRTLLNIAHQYLVSHDLSKRLSIYHVSSRSIQCIRTSLRTKDMKTLSV